MQVPESAYECYMSEPILPFAYLTCPSVSGAKALKKCLRIAIFNFSEKLQSIFEIGLKTYGVFTQKLLSLKKCFKRKIRRHVFVVYVLIYPLSKFGGIAHCRNVRGLGRVSYIDQIENLNI